MCKRAYHFAAICFHYSVFDRDFSDNTAHEAHQFELASGVCKKLRPGVTRTKTPIAASLTCKDGWTGFNLNCYKFTEKRGNWHECESECKEMNSNMSSILSKAENEFVKSLAKRNKKNFVWLGAKKQEEPPKKFVWTDGSPFDFTSWMKGEPSNQDGWNENCIEMLPHENGNWNDLDW